MKFTPALFVLGLTLVIAGCSKKDQEPRGTIDSTVVDARPGMLPAPHDSAATDSLARGPWHWIATVTPVERIAPASPENYTLEFMPDRSVSARIDCNRGSGGYHIEGKSIRFGPLATTKMMCPPGSLDIKFAQQIEAARNWFMQGDTLMMDLIADSGTMRFVR